MDCVNLCYLSNVVYIYIYIYIYRYIAHCVVWCGVYCILSVSLNDMYLWLCASQVEHKMISSWGGIACKGHVQGAWYGNYNIETARKSADLKAGLKAYYKWYIYNQEHLDWLNLPEVQYTRQCNVQ